MEGYHTAIAEIDGSYILFRLKTDEGYLQRKHLEALAKLEAEEAARLAEQRHLEQERLAEKKRLEQERIAAERAAAAKAKAEEQARLAEEKRLEQERIAAERAAAAKAKAEEQARLAEEKRLERERIAAEKVVAAKAKAEEKRQLRKGYTAAYASNCKGFGSTVELSAMIGMQSAQTYGSVRYIAGYNFNSTLYLGAGTGVNYHFFGSSIEATSSITYLPPYRLSVPVFAYFRANFMDKYFSPFVAVSAGCNVSPKQTIHLELTDAKYPASSIFVNPQVGVRYITSPKTSMYIAVGFQCITVPKCLEYTSFGATLKHALTYGVNVHLGFNF